MGIKDTLLTKTWTLRRESREHYATSMKRELELYDDKNEINSESGPTAEIDRVSPTTNLMF